MQQATVAAAASSVSAFQYGQVATTSEALRAGILPSPIYNINVSGAIDSEGTARTIVDTLNDSYYRGTNGASILAGLR